MDIASLETPAVLLKRQQLEANLQSMQRYAHAIGAALRPHFKTHKCLTIARRQLALGAAGFTVAKCSEAVLLFENGAPSVAIAHSVLDSAKLARVITSAKKTNASVRVHVDSVPGVVAAADAAQAAGYHLEVALEVDVGLKRCGIDPHAPEVEKILAEIGRHKALSFEGISSHAGHSYGAASVEELHRFIADECNLMLELKSRIEGLGQQVKLISVGATPTLLTEPMLKGITELRPGNYVFLDLTAERIGFAPLSSVSLFVLATIVSRNDLYYILDCGSKTLSSDLGAHGTGAVGYGACFPYSQDFKCTGRMRIAKLSEEHAFVERAGSELQLGTKVLIIPNHACPVANLARQYNVIDATAFERWGIEGSGLVQ